MADDSYDSVSDDESDSYDGSYDNVDFGGSWDPGPSVSDAQSSGGSENESSGSSEAAASSYDGSYEGVDDGGTSAYNAAAAAESPGGSYGAAVASISQEAPSSYGGYSGNENVSYAEPASQGLGGWDPGVAAGAQLGPAADYDHGMAQATGSWVDPGIDVQGVIHGNQDAPDFGSPSMDIYSSMAVSHADRAAQDAVNAGVRDPDTLNATWNQNLQEGIASAQSQAGWDAQRAGQQRGEAMGQLGTDFDYGALANAFSRGGMGQYAQDQRDAAYAQAMGRVDWGPRGPAQEYGAQVYAAMGRPEMGLTTEQQRQNGMELVARAEALRGPDPAGRIAEQWGEAGRNLQAAFDPGRDLSLGERAGYLGGAIMNAAQVPVEIEQHGFPNGRGGSTGGWQDIQGGLVTNPVTGTVPEGLGLLSEINARSPLQGLTSGPMVAQGVPGQLGLGSLQNPNLAQIGLAVSPFTNPNLPSQALGAAQHAAEVLKNDPAYKDVFDKYGAEAAAMYAQSRYNVQPDFMEAPVSKFMYGAIDPVNFAPGALVEQAALRAELAGLTGTSRVLSMAARGAEAVDRLTNAPFEVALAGTRGLGRGFEAAMGAGRGFEAGMRSGAGLVGSVEAAGRGAREGLASGPLDLSRADRVADRGAELADYAAQARRDYAPEQIRSEIVGPRGEVLSTVDRAAPVSPAGLELPASAVAREVPSGRVEVSGRAPEPEVARAEPQLQAMPERAAPGRSFADLQAEASRQAELQGLSPVERGRVEAEFDRFDRLGEPYRDETPDMRGPAPSLAVERQFDRQAPVGGHFVGPDTISGRGSLMPNGSEARGQAPEGPPSQRGGLLEHHQEAANRGFLDAAMRSNGSADRGAFAEPVQYGPPGGPLKTIEGEYAPYKTGQYPGGRTEAETAALVDADGRSLQGVRSDLVAEGRLAEPERGVLDPVQERVRQQGARDVVSQIEAAGARDPSLRDMPPRHVDEWGTPREGWGADREVTPQQLEAARSRAAVGPERGEAAAARANGTAPHVEPTPAQGRVVAQVQAGTPVEHAVREAVAEPLSVLAPLAPHHAEFFSGLRDAPGPPAAWHEREGRIAGWALDLESGGRRAEQARAEMFKQFGARALSEVPDPLSAAIGASLRDYARAVGFKAPEAAERAGYFEAVATMLGLVHDRVRTGQLAAPGTIARDALDQGFRAFQEGMPHAYSFMIPQLQSKLDRLGWQGAEGRVARGAGERPGSGFSREMGGYGSVRDVAEHGVLGAARRGVPAEMLQALGRESVLDAAHPALGQASRLLGAGEAAFGELKGIQDAAFRTAVYAHFADRQMTKELTDLARDLRQTLVANGRSGRDLQKSVNGMVEVGIHDRAALDAYLGGIGLTPEQRNAFVPQAMTAMEKVRNAGVEHAGRVGVNYGARSELEASRGWNALFSFSKFALSNFGYYGHALLSNGRLQHVLSAYAHEVDQEHARGLGERTPNRLSESVNIASYVGRDVASAIASLMLGDPRAEVFANPLGMLVAGKGQFREGFTGSGASGFGEAVAQIQGLGLSWSPAVMAVVATLGHLGDVPINAPIGSRSLEGQAIQGVYGGLTGRPSYEADFSRSMRNLGGINQQVADPERSQTGIAHMADVGARNRVAIDASREGLDPRTNPEVMRSYNDPLASRNLTARAEQEREMSAPGQLLQGMGLKGMSREEYEARQQQAAFSRDYRSPTNPTGTMTFSQALANHPAADTFWNAQDPRSYQEALARQAELGVAMPTAVRDTLAVDKPEFPGIGVSRAEMEAYEQARSAWASQRAAPAMQHAMDTFENRADILGALEAQQRAEREQQRAHAAERTQSMLDQGFHAGTYQYDQLQAQLAAEQRGMLTNQAAAHRDLQGSLRNEAAYTPGMGQYYTGGPVPMGSEEMLGARNMNPVNFEHQVAYNQMQGTYGNIMATYGAIKAAAERGEVNKDLPSAFLQDQLATHQQTRELPGLQDWLQADRPQQDRLSQAVRESVLEAYNQQPLGSRSAFVEKLPSEVAAVAFGGLKDPRTGLERAAATPEQIVAAAQLLGVELAPKTVARSIKPEFDYSPAAWGGGRVETVNLAQRTPYGPEGFRTDRGAFERGQVAAQPQAITAARGAAIEQRAAQQAAYEARGAARAATSRSYGPATGRTSGGTRGGGYMGAEFGSQPFSGGTLSQQYASAFAHAQQLEAQQERAGSRFLADNYDRLAELAQQLGKPISPRQSFLDKAAPADRPGAWDGLELGEAINKFNGMAHDLQGAVKAAAEGRFDPPSFAASWADKYGERLGAPDLTPEALQSRLDWVTTNLHQGYKYRAENPQGQREQQEHEARGVQLQAAREALEAHGKDVEAFYAQHVAPYAEQRQQVAAARAEIAQRGASLKGTREAAGYWNENRSRFDALGQQLKELDARLGPAYDHLKELKGRGEELRSDLDRSKKRR